MRSSASSKMRNKQNNTQITNTQKTFGNSKNNKIEKVETKYQPNSPLKFPKTQSDRQRATPMEIDPSLRSNHRNKINNHDTLEDDEKDDTEENNESDFEEEVNFQISQADNVVK